MKILALDTSTERCSAALVIDDTLFEREELAVNRHSESILQMVEDMLAQAKIELTALDGIAFAAGPGSFTGLRIACGVAQGLAFGANLKVVGVSTLEALAEACGRERVIACLDARMGEVYLAAYEKQAGMWVEILPPGLYSPAMLPPRPQGSWFGCGSGFAAHREALAAHFSPIEVVDGISPGAAQVARLAASEFAAGKGIDPAEAAPVYIRDKVAKKECER